MAVASIRVPAPRAAITAFLDELDQYVVLRNHDIWANFERGSDIDVLTGDAERASRLISRHLGKPLITIRRAGATSYVFRWGHIDLLSNLSWRGAHYLETAEALQHTSVSALGFNLDQKIFVRQRAHANLRQLLCGCDPSGAPSGRLCVHPGAYHPA